MVITLKGDLSGINVPDFISSCTEFLHELLGYNSKTRCIAARSGSIIIDIRGWEDELKSIQDYVNAENPFNILAVSYFQKRKYLLLLFFMFQCCIQPELRTCDEKRDVFHTGIFKSSDPFVWFSHPSKIINCIFLTFPFDCRSILYKHQPRYFGGSIICMFVFRGTHHLHRYIDFQKFSITFRDSII